MLDALKPEDVVRVLRIHLTLVKDRATEPPRISEAAWQRIAGLRGDYWPAFIERAQRKGILFIEGDGRISGPWANKVFAERVKESQRKRQNRTGTAAAQIEQRAASDPLAARQRSGGDFQRASTGEKSETSQCGASSAVEQPSTNRNLKENRLSPHTPLPSFAHGVSEVLFGSQNDDASPGRKAVVELLIEPILRARKFDAPDPAFALGAIADLAETLPGQALVDVREKILATRKAVVKASDMEDALKVAAKRKAQVDALENGHLVFKTSPRWTIAMQKLAAVDPFEAERCRATDFVRRDFLEKTLGSNWGEPS